MGYFKATVRRVIPVLAIEMLVPLLLDDYFSGTYMDFASWIIFVILLDVAYPNVVPKFEMCNFTVRAVELLKLQCIWVLFKNAMFLIHLGLTNCDLDYNSWYYIDMICTIRHIMPVFGVVTLFMYSYLSSFRQHTNQTNIKNKEQERLEINRCLEVSKALVYYAKVELGKCFTTKSAKKAVKPDVLGSGEGAKKQDKNTKRPLVIKRIEEALGIF